MKLVANSIVKKLVKDRKIDTDNYGLDYIRYAISVEMEHKALIGHDTSKALTIALAHIEEYPNYYLALHEMEKKLNAEWKRKQKPAIFIK